MTEPRAYYEAEYHRTDWTLADAFRTQPGWGMKTRLVPADTLPPGHTDAQLIEAAQSAAPEGFRLTRLTYSSWQGERVLFHTSADARLAP